MNNDLGGILDTGPRHHFVAGWIAPDKINESGNGFRSVLCEHNTISVPPESWSAISCRISAAVSTPRLPKITIWSFIFKTTKTPFLSLPSAVFLLMHTCE